MFVSGDAKLMIDIGSSCYSVDFLKLRVTDSVNKTYPVFELNDSNSMTFVSPESDSSDGAKVI